MSFRNTEAYLDPSQKSKIELFMKSTNMRQMNIQLHSLRNIRFRVNFDHVKCRITKLYIR